jgi:hypothetical protein
MPRRKSDPEADTKATEETTEDNDRATEAETPEGNESRMAGRVNPDA